MTALRTIRVRYPDGTESVARAGILDSALVAMQREGLSIRHDCGGKAQCGTCRMRVLSGKASIAGERERERLSAVGADPGMRLACQTRFSTDAVVEPVLPVVREAASGRGGTP